MLWALLVIAAIFVLFLQVSFVFVFRWVTVRRPPPCPDDAHHGRYTLQPLEELVINSYPGPPRPFTSAGQVAIEHDLPAPDLLPITTVTNATGSVDLVVESFPNETWYAQLNLPASPPTPQLALDEQSSLTYTKVFPEEGQPGIPRAPTNLGIPRVEARPIYLVSLGAGQSTTAYGDPPGAWLRLRAGREGARGSYCTSWCCPENVRAARPYVSRRDVPGAPPVPPPPEGLPDTRTAAGPPG